MDPIPNPNPNSNPNPNPNPNPNQARLELLALPGFPLWEGGLFGLLCTWHHLLRATYDAYASPLRPGPGGGLTRERALLPRGARVLAPQAWLDLCCACGLDKALPPPRLSEALQRAVRDVGARAAPQRGGGVASEPADFVGFVQALIASTLP